MTDEKISNLTDEQINVMMTVNLCGLHDGFTPNEVSGHSIMEFDDGDNSYTAYVEDYCNDPAVMWPIVFDCRMNVIAPLVGDAWSVSCSSNQEVYDHADSNPLRAAAIVYLKIKGGL